MNSMQIQYFISVAEHLNFTKAAESLYTSQPSLSKQIALLEKEFELQLFVRTKQYVHLTPAGSILFKEFKEMSQRLDTILEKARHANLGIEGELNIGCLEVMNTNLFLPSIVNKFTQSYPNINLSFESYSFKALRDKLINDELDIGFTISFELVNTPNIQRHVVYQSNAHIVLPISHPLVNKENLTLMDFKDDSFIVTTESPAGIDFVVALCKKHGFSPKKLINSPTLESMVLYLELGHGVAIMDTSLRIFENTNLRFIKISGEDAILNVNAAWRTDNLNPSAILFINQLTSQSTSNDSNI